MPESDRTSVGPYVSESNISDAQSEELMHGILLKVYIKLVSDTKFMLVRF